MMFNLGSFELAINPLGFSIVSMTSVLVKLIKLKIYILLSQTTISYSFLSLTFFTGYENFISDTIFAWESSQIITLLGVYLVFCPPPTKAIILHLLIISTILIPDPRFLSKLSLNGSELKILKPFSEPIEKQDPS